jgi:hypothetical protein
MLSRRGLEYDGLSDLNSSNLMAIDDDSVRDLTEQPPSVKDREVDPCDCGGCLYRILVRIAAWVWSGRVSGHISWRRRFAHQGAACSTEVGPIFEHLAAAGAVLDRRSTLSAKARAIFKLHPAFCAVRHQVPFVSSCNFKHHMWMMPGRQPIRALFGDDSRLIGDDREMCMEFPES